VISISVISSSVHSLLLLYLDLSVVLSICLSVAVFYWGFSRSVLIFNTDRWNKHAKRLSNSVNPWRFYRTHTPANTPKTPLESIQFISPYCLDLQYILPVHSLEFLLRGSDGFTRPNLQKSLPSNYLPFR
jgi:hypothetical protein